MPDDVNGQPYDPDAPPESSFITDFVGVLKASIFVAPDKLGEIDPRIAKSAQDYWGDRAPAPLWYLEAHGLSVIRTDGQPFRQSDIIALTDKKGKFLGKGMAPDVFAAAYRGFNVSASYLRAGQPDSAVERAFHFKTTEVALGKKFKKKFDLYPVELFPVGYTYDGPITEVEPASESDEGAAPTSAPKVSEEQAVALLRTTLAGKAPAQMFDAILADPSLKAVGSVFGVNLIEAATDESLANVLTENKVLVLNDGVFAVPA